MSVLFCATIFFGEQLLFSDMMVVCGIPLPVPVCIPFLLYISLNGGHTYTLIYCSVLRIYEYKCYYEKCMFNMDDVNEKRGIPTTCEPECHHDIILDERNV